MDNVIKLGSTTINEAIIIGRRGEYNANSLSFDISDYIEAYGDGTVKLQVKRSGDSEAYIVEPIQTDNLVTWRFSSYDTEKEGYGWLQVLYYVGSVILAKSERMRTFVEASLVGETPAPPSADIYTGDYEAVPIIDSDQTLETANKYMVSDITVKKIPYQEVSNSSGGLTVTIGG